MTQFIDVVEEFNRFYIRLPRRRNHAFSTLSVLDALACDDRPKRLTELIASEQLSQPGLTQLVKRLERDGLVERGRDPRDGRAVLVRITQKGRNIGESCRGERAEQLAPLIALLTPAERRALARALPALRRLTRLGRDGTADAVGPPGHVGRTGEQAPRARVCGAHGRHPACAAEGAPRPSQ
ncbi:MarR family winged helix-turn-helix transcriptional regulator [Streptomyces anatolicus]|uniref:MarR family winged helix-turn-helix transcriptional regulator n=1 Tax=Streptomyces anatolicus TaxID=2675858 RepID=UPI0027DF86EA|nr:MarR family transcriptional regulator [Streptomyces anatolicus]